MKKIAETFFSLSAEEKKKVHVILCEYSLKNWNEYISNFEEMQYTESVCGTKQQVDKNLPADALESSKRGVDDLSVERRYSEPIVAMQDDDLEFPEPVEFAYYSIYNLFRKYICGENIDDWLIVNQALSSKENIDSIHDILSNAIARGQGSISNKQKFLND
ncbi:MAG: hypothetical protein GY754_36435 [bacterium]|nr:hypothetical protein [bacterium]